LGAGNNRACADRIHRERLAAVRAVKFDLVHRELPGSFIHQREQRKPFGAPEFLVLTSGLYQLSKLQLGGDE
jgi:hypothetical protein